MNNLAKSTRVYVEGYLRKRRVLRKTESDGLPDGQYAKYDESWEVIATDISTMSGKSNPETSPSEILKDTPGDTFSDLP